MNCYLCKKICIFDNSKSKLFCSTCNCKLIYHFQKNTFDDITVIYKDLGNIAKSLTESSHLARSFGLHWLPIGIQPSEVDRFLKSFRTNSDEKMYLFKNCDSRNVQIQMQIPKWDRTLSEMKYTKTDLMDRAAKFFKSRKRMNINVGRIDHLDVPEGQSCTYCSKIISFGEICVLAQHNSKGSGKHSCWHPNCFCCLECRHVLVDYIYLWETDSDTNQCGPFCMRHFDERHRPRCSYCDELIFDAECVIVGENQYYHQDHLICAKCDRNLSDGVTEFSTTTDTKEELRCEIKCLKCIYGGNYKICNICEEPISEEEVKKSGKEQHENCSFCHSCNTSVVDHGSGWHRYRNGYIVCEECQTGTGIRFCCRRCGEDVDLDSEYVLRTGRFLWHRTCLLQCGECGENVCQEDVALIDADTRSRLKNGLRSVGAGDLLLPICVTCFKRDYSEVCAKCNQNIEGAGVNHNSKVYHDYCFVCKECGKSLDFKKFVSKDECVFCIECCGKLFAKTCEACSSSILGSDNNKTMVGFEGKYWHQNCFKCYRCDIGLLDCGFLFTDDKLYCTECNKK